MTHNLRTRNDAETLLDTFAAELTCAAYHVALRHGAAGTWLDLQLDLWQALADTVGQWQRKSSTFLGAIGQSTPWDRSRGRSTS